MQKKLTSLLVLCFIGLSCLGQAVATTFQTERIRDLRSAKEHPYVCTFKIHGNDRVDWIQGDVTYDFPITSTDGDLKGEGATLATFNITKEGKSGKVVVEREESGKMWLTLDLREGNQMGAYYKFEVSIP